ncbi:Acyl-CoA N-acyltransferases (NAT) superfamily protein isoform 1 [Gossypium australe]|uniref:Acyl-CoA N-acyltransferases (NAT) superfamily protein isoform 1 n=1 Tax=Gossypium australe TaxID=47621 RepID=A0A5B6VP31_9ROSI|nr:Acyl-CoA N-acyltransferases (NAT) superfamily protein isoform 1 [Gossypium australe]
MDSVCKVLSLGSYFLRVSLNGNGIMTFLKSVLTPMETRVRLKALACIFFIQEDSFILALLLSNPASLFKNVEQKRTLLPPLQCFPLIIVGKTSRTLLIDKD